MLGGFKYFRLFIIDLGLPLPGSHGFMFWDKTICSNSVRGSNGHLSGYSERHGGLMVTVLDSRSRSLGVCPGRSHCVVFLVKTLFNSHSASLHPGV